MRETLSLIAIFLLASCAAQTKQPQRVILKHPETHDFQTCKGGKWQNEESFKAVENCIKEYKALGYRVWGQR